MPGDAGTAGRGLALVSGVGLRLVVPGATVLSLVKRGGACVVVLFVSAAPGVSCTFTPLVMPGIDGVTGAVEAVVPPTALCC
jgi:hypothetical protein